MRFGVGSMPKASKADRDPTTYRILLESEVYEQKPIIIIIKVVKKAKATTATRTAISPATDLIALAHGCQVGRGSGVNELK